MGFYAYDTPTKVEDKYTIEQIKRAISLCPKHTIKVDADPVIDGLDDSEIKTIEFDYFLYKLELIKKNEK